MMTSINEFELPIAEKERLIHGLNPKNFQP